MERLWEEIYEPLSHLRLSDSRNHHATIVQTCGSKEHRPSLGYLDDGRAASPEDRRGLAAGLGVATRRLVFMEQIHGAGVVEVDSSAAGAGLDHRASAVAGVDALVTSASDIALVGLSADCPLVALWDATAGRCAMIHAGWRGLAQGVLAESVKEMTARGADARNILGAVGPAAQACCYEVGPDVLHALAHSALGSGDGVRTQNGRTTVDLVGVALHQLAALGIARDRVVTCDACTVCGNRFHSYRREGAKAGRQALAIRLKE